MSLFISKTVQDTAIVYTMDTNKNWDLSNGAISNYLQLPLTYVKKFENGTRYSYSYTGRLMESFLWFIE